ncbi:MAG: omptin family outer membrane protease [Spirochaetia bacterium]|jgi:outer membrane protease
MASKNPSRQRRLVVSLYVVALFVCAYTAASQSLVLTASTETGVILGGARELVYDGNGHTMSELNWPLLPVTCLGAKIDLSTRAGFLASGELQVGLAGPDGTMTDSDWDGNGAQTGYSQANSILERAITAEAQLGWALPVRGLGPVSLLAPFAGFECLLFKWSAQNGYLQYPPTAAPTPVFGTSVSYLQSFYIPEGGVKAEIRLLPNLTVAFSFAFSPYLWFSDVDEHTFRFLEFFDAMQGGYLLQPRLSVAYRITPKATFALDALYRHVAGLIGNSTAIETGATGTQYPTITNGAGASLDAVHIQLVLGLSL